MKKNKIKKIGKSVFAFAAVLSPIAGVISCGGGSNKVDVGATVWKAADPFMSVVKKGFDKGAKISNQTFSWSDGEGDQTKINDKVTALINSGVKALAINLVDPASAQTVVDKAKAKGIPIILYNKEAKPAVMGSYDKVWYVGTRSRESGEMQVVDIAKAIKDGILKDRNQDGKLGYIIINGEAAHPDAMARTEAVRVDLPKELAKLDYQTDFSSFTPADYKFFDKDGKITTTIADGKWAVKKATSRLFIKKGANVDDLSMIYKDFDYTSNDPKNTMYNTTDWSTAKGKEKAQPKIAANADKNTLDFIAANNDGTALGAVAAAKESSFINLDSKAKATTYVNGAAVNYMPIFGVDSTGAANSSIEDGWLTGTVLNDGINQGAIAMLMAVNSYKKGTDNVNIMSNIDVNTYKYTNELNKNTKAIRVAYKGIYRNAFTKFQ